MDIGAILDLVAKGITVAMALESAGEKALPALEVVWNTITGAQQGTISDDQLAANEATLDGLISDFNLPMTKPDDGTTTT